MKPDFIKKTWLTFSLLTLISALVGFLAWQQFAQITKAHEMIAHTYEVVSHINGLHTAITQAESAQRGFFVSGRKELLDNYRAVITPNSQESSIYQELGILKKITHDNPFQQKRVHDLENALSEKIQFMDEVIALRQEYSLEEARKRLENNPQGLILMNEIYGLIDGLRTEERRLLDYRRKHYQQENSMILGAALGLIFMLISVVGGAIWSIQREFNRRRAAETSLYELSAFQKAILDSSQSAIIVTDINGVITMFNPSAQNMLGYAADEVVGVHTPLLFHDPEELEKRSDELSQAMGYPVKEMEVFLQIPKAHRSENRDWTYYRKDGTSFPVSLSVSSLYDDKGIIIGFVGMAADITERRQIEKMKNEFISTVSHELRTPLTSIRGSLGLLAGNIAGDIPEKAQDLIQIAYKNSERLVRLINNILDIEKIESGHIVFDRKPIQVSALLQQAKEDAEALVNGTDIAIAMNIKCGDAVIIGDMDRLLQVMTNLLSNAVKFSPPQSAIMIEALRHDNGMIEIGVRDQGEGIPEEFRKRIFGKFAQSEVTRAQQKSGSGLGLSISRSIMHSMDGTIDFLSEKGNTYFYLQMPEMISTAKAQPTEKSPRILICEENRDVGAFLEMILTRAGYKCDTAAQPNEVKNLLLNHNYAAITMDISIADGKGFSLIRDIRDMPETSGIPVVVITAMPHGNGIDLAAAGIVDWLSKPIDVEHLLKVLKGLAPDSGKTRLLHVEDDEDITRFLSNAMAHVDVISAPALSVAREYLDHQNFDLAVLDIYLPDGNGLDLLPELAERHIPVVVLSVDETSHDIQRYVCASLVKTVVSETKVIETIKTYIGKRA